MKHRLIVICVLLMMFELSHTVLLGQDTWIKLIGGNGLDWGQSITTTQDGGCVVTGWGDSYAFEDVNRYITGAIVTKIDLKGKIAWTKLFGGSRGAQGFAVTTAADDALVVTGMTYSNDYDFVGTNKGKSDIFVLKVDKYGNEIWKRTIGGTEEEIGLAISTTANDGIIVSGYTISNDLDFRVMNKGRKDHFVVRMSVSGEVVSKTLLGGSNDEFAWTMTTTKDDGVLLAGASNSADGDIRGSGRMNIYVLRLNTKGDVIWKKSYRGNDWDAAHAAVVAPDDGFLIVGRFTSNSGDFNGLHKGNGDIFIIKLDANGSHLWQRVYGGSGDDNVCAIVAAEDGGYVLTGWTSSNDDDFEGLRKGQEDVLVLKVDKDGNVIWKKLYGGTGNDRGHSIQITSDGGMVITGKAESNDGDFNGMNKGWSDAFVLKLDENGNYTSNTSASGPNNEAVSLIVYPNPSSSTSTLAFTNEVPSVVRIELLDILGQIVEVLYDEFTDADTIRLPMNISHLNAGVYTIMKKGASVKASHRFCIIR